MPIQNTKISAKERRIFRYTRADAWETTISQVDVMEGVEKGNVRCLYFVTPRLHANTIVDSCTITISQNHIDMIRDAMLTHLEVLDGFINTFEFAPEESFSNIITVFNISAFRDNVDVAIIGNPPYRGKEVLKLYDDISKILSDNGVSQKYLALDFSIFP